MHKLHQIAKVKRLGLGSEENVYGNKSLSIRFNKVKVSENASIQTTTIYLDVSARNLSSQDATIYVIGKNEALPSLMIPAVRKTIRRDGVTAAEISFFQNTLDFFNTRELNNTYKAHVICDGLIAESVDFQINQITENTQEMQTCLCKKVDWKADNLKLIVTQLRKKDIIRKNGRSIRDKNNKIIDYEDWTIYNDYIDWVNKVEIQDKLFYLKREERIDSNQANFSFFSKELSKFFKDFEINTCIRKIHFLTQIYHESQRFAATYENVTNTGYDGGDFYQGRGFIQLTHKYNYKDFYQYLFNREPTEQELIDFSPKVATNLAYALKASGWYWQKNNINKYADLDDIEKVSAAVNYPTLLTSNTFNPDKINGIIERKKYYSLLKEIFNYENCSK